MSLLDDNFTSDTTPSAKNQKIISSQFRISQIATGTVIPVRHFITNCNNTVVVGGVSRLPTAALTVRQPVYLRLGFGIFLRKCRPPRRAHYGKKEPRRLQFRDSDGREGRGRGGALCRTLYQPGVLMTNRPITLTTHPHRLWWGRSPLHGFNLPAEQQADLQAKVEKLTALQRIVKPTPRSRQPYQVSLPSQDERYVFWDAEDWKPPPPLPFFPPPPLGPPIVESSDSDTLEAMYSDTEFLLRRPSPPSIRLPRHPSSSAESSSSVSWGHSLHGEQSATDVVTSTSAANLAAAQHRPRRRPVPTVLPWVPDRSAAATKPRTRWKVQVTSARTQGTMVELGDVFPYRADKGLLQEMAFYEKEKNFPLLMTRNQAVDLEEFTALNDIRCLPQHIVHRVHVLDEVTARHHKAVQDLKESDSDMEDGCGLEDDVFNPLAYPFNQQAYAEIYRASAANKL